MLKGWAAFRTEAASVELVLGLRRQLDRLLKTKIEAPATDLSHGAHCPACPPARPPPTARPTAAA
eukprot:SAG11_NODE_12352_length_707_cov_2.156250_1_plen_64_part_10